MRLRTILATGLALAGAILLSACGQKGPLFISHTPASQQRATLPQTVFGGAHAPASAASAASAPATPAPPPPPELPEIK